MTYRHVTNLMKPYSETDARFLVILADYREGEPAPAKPVDGAEWTPRTVEEMKADGVVGIYTTLERLQDSRVRACTGWLEPREVLGVVWGG